MSKISVILVEDQASTRQGLKTMLSFLTTDIDVIAEAVTADEAVQKALHHRPDVVLMDFHIPSKFSVLQDGFSATKAICYDWPEARVLIVTNHDGDENIDSARNAGARGYILKDAEFDEIAKAIRALHQGKKYIWSEIASQVSESRDLPKLTATESRILELMAEGASNEKIAQSLKLNLGQVKTTNVRMYRKLGVGSRVEAINCARRRGLVPPL